MYYKEIEYCMQYTKQKFAATRKFKWPNQKNAQELFFWTMKKYSKSECEKFLSASLFNSTSNPLAITPPVVINQYKMHRFADLFETIINNYYVFSQLQTKYMY